MRHPDRFRHIQCRLPLGVPSCHPLFGWSCSGCFWTSGVKIGMFSRIIYMTQCKNFDYENGRWRARYIYIEFTGRKSLNRRECHPSPCLPSANPPRHHLDLLHVPFPLHLIIYCCSSTLVCSPELVSSLSVTGRPKPMSRVCGSACSEFCEACICRSARVGICGAFCETKFSRER